MTQIYTFNALSFSRNSGFDIGSPMEGYMTGAWFQNTGVSESSNLNDESSSVMRISARRISHQSVPLRDNKDVLISSWENLNPLVVELMLKLWTAI